jgi:hypothetical protein
MNSSSLLTEIEQAAQNCNTSLIRLLSIIHARADQSQATSAVASIQKASWGVKDAHEFKARQLLVNCDENVMRTIPAFLTFLRKLTAETEQDVAHLMQPEFPAQHLQVISSKFSEVTSVFYHI